MKAVRILEFGPPDVIRYEEIPRPEPFSGQLRVRVKAAGVGPWDALVREGKSGLKQPLPVIPGSDISGIVEALGPGVSDFKAGDEVYGATSEQFTGGYAEYALASAKMLAPKPSSLSFIEAASAPVVAVTAWQMLFEYAHAAAGQNILIHGAGGNVGAYAVQLARLAGLHIAATAGAASAEYVRSLGAEKVVDYETARFEESLAPVDIVLDTVGGDTQRRSLHVLKPGGILVSAVLPVPDPVQKQFGVKAVFFYVEVTTARLKALTELFNNGKLVTQVGTVLPLAEARAAHEMLGGAPHKPGKIVLQVAD
jgi:NADPH:quinone reductase-like Zn-dependent oxidoreductase